MTDDTHEQTRACPERVSTPSDCGPSCRLSSRPSSGYEAPSRLHSHYKTHVGCGWLW